jgi:aspartate/methionine/tyrosine aminotransferase
MSLDIRYAPWQFMLDIDKINYALSERVAYCTRHPDDEVINLSSGINALGPPLPLVDFALSMARDPLFWHDYDGPDGHLAGRVGVAVYESVHSGGLADLGPDNVIVTAGASAAMMLAVRGLRQLCHKQGLPAVALLPLPTFPLAGAALVNAGFAIVEAGSTAPGRWLPTVPDLIAQAPDDLGVVYVNTFNNPTGERYEADELRELVRWASEHGVFILHDTVSSDVASAGTIPHLATVAAQQGYAEHVLTVSSLSKARAIPGFRIGWLIGPEDIVGELARFNELIAPSSPGIAAPMLLLDRLIAMSTGPGARPAGEVVDRVAGCLEPYAAAEPGLITVFESVAKTFEAGEVTAPLVAWRQQLRDVLAENVAILGSDFADLAGWFPPWRGDFNTFAELLPLRGRPYLSTCHQLFREFGLQTLPAPAFGQDETWWRKRPEYFSRLSFAVPTPIWTEALSRLRRAAGKLRCR